MRPWTLADIEQAIRHSWSLDTCAPGDRPRWHAGNPARGQCGVTALVVNDLLGGDLVRGEVHIDGQRTDFHWWNRFAGGVDIDLTREQFTAEEMVTPGIVIPRQPRLKRLVAEYELLRRQVHATLGTGTRAGQTA
jgi:hypothetical protein